MPFFAVCDSFTTSATEIDLKKHMVASRSKKQRRKHFCNGALKLYMLFY